MLPSLHEECTTQRRGGSPECFAREPIPGIGSCRHEDLERYTYMRRDKRAARVARMCRRFVYGTLSNALQRRAQDRLRSRIPTPYERLTDLPSTRARQKPTPSRRVFAWSARAARPHKAHQESVPCSMQSAARSSSGQLAPRSQVELCFVRRGVGEESPAATSKQPRILRFRWRATGGS